MPCAGDLSRARGGTGWRGARSLREFQTSFPDETEFNDPDWTVGVKLGRDRNGGYWLLDIVRARANPGDVEKLLLDTAAHDGKRVRIGFGQDPGQAEKPGASPGARAQRLPRVAGVRKWRQAHTLRAVQFAVSGR